ncbi:hypothetical protein CONPUDRAFT_163704 [Coniophora puteana RWD-64-598 SS2]|uniref:Uncharacterized protein n=1 Tax=Coniophora puteana (strain RWD-64-598) TaxID=741705 RepID=A0A5M3MUZ1_CONPW|nr:uncharacterized protein CONPUDRAFT_163704 [Coniophora puteana RWD-64-598 SS2]EIW82564.1 hypothetical protein CONPUDRAFT_163704 [Coniophora puteana RWD-64-598 SS2]
MSAQSPYEFIYNAGTILQSCEQMLINFRTQSGELAALSLRERYQRAVTNQDKLIRHPPRDPVLAENHFRLARGLQREIQSQQQRACGQHFQRI